MMHTFLHFLLLVIEVAIGTSVGLLSATILPVLVVDKLVIGDHRERWQRGNWIIAHDFTRFGFGILLTISDVQRGNYVKSVGIHFSTVQIYWQRPT